MMRLALLPTLLAAVAAQIGTYSGISEDGERPQRRNIADVSNEKGPYWDLYIQALAGMQRANESDIDSFYGLAGSCPPSHGAVT
jgi:hypothetical protein